MEHEFEPLQNDLILRTAWGMFMGSQLLSERLLDAIANFARPEG
jgi:hypothetical protein